MGKQTGISWTDHTFNPWWGCTEVSAECIACYAKKLAKRYGHDIWGLTKARRPFGEKHWQEPLAWNEAAKAEGRRHRVFCASMADVFEDYRGPTDLAAERKKLWTLIEATPWLDWQLLTKRPENFGAYLPIEWLKDPPRNVWLGVSAGGQEWADERIPLLLKMKFSVLWVSAEPLLGPVDFRKWLPGGSSMRDRRSIGWIITGGESGAGARPCDLAWIRDIDAQCKSTGAAHFVKQLGNTPITDSEEAKRAGLTTRRSRKGFILPSGKVILKLASYKADDPAEWPEDLRIQAFPVPGRGERRTRTLRQHSSRSPRLVAGGER